MNTLNKMMILVMMAGTTSLIAHADETAAVTNGSPAPHIEKRIERQESRIDHKVQKGKITAAQGEKLKQDVEAVKTKEQSMVAQNGGKKLTKAQRKELRQNLKQTNQEIKSTSTSGAPVTPVQK